MRTKIVGLIASCVCTLMLGLSWAQTKSREWSSGIAWPEPVVVTPGETSQSRPADAISLFDGTDTSAWEGAKAPIVADGAFEIASTLRTKAAFGDCQLHLEFATPAEVEGEGQARGNSGVYFMGKYEVQILDSYDNKTYFDGQCGSIYKQHPPLVNACRKPGEWQTYDIIFTAPRFNADGSLKSPAVITALQNGVLIQNHYELLGGTYFEQPPSYTAHADRLPLQLQYHRDAVKFRNIWIRDLAPKSGEGEKTEAVNAEAAKTEPVKKEEVKPAKKPKKADKEKGVKTEKAEKAE
ncbi:3-keto-disaccharide hydrolase [Planctomicrobium sp. SH664]|uniref:3-keto-disaccharide hydrolase n=1 Tax=Planctomicrobium sp. SH664 TaxID=3448125 RepID=UPI003F5B288F